METGYFTAKGDNCYNVLNDFIASEYGFIFKKQLQNGVLYCSEDYSLSANSNLMIVITVERIADNETLIEIIAGGGGRGMFNINVGNEDRRIANIYKRVIEFCNDLDYEISHLKS